MSIRKQKLEELRSYIEEMKTIEFLDKRQLRIENDKIEKCFLSIEKTTCLLGNGEIIEREKILKNGKNGNAGIILPITKEGKTLLVVQPRPNTKSTVGIEFPAGYMELGEEPIVTAKRELIEETGYIPKKMISMSNPYYQDQGCMSAYNYNFLAIGCEKKKEQNLDASEFIRYFECTYKEALELAKLGYINDINSLYALKCSKEFLNRYGKEKILRRHRLCTRNMDL